MMTPASVDGGPDEGPVLKEVRRRHAIAWDNVAYGPHEPTAATYWQAQKDALSDLGEWLKTNEPRPTTARDAALREEGMAVGLAMRALEKISCEHVAFPEENYPGYASMALVAAREALAAIHALAAKPSPDASQGSAPRTDLEVFEDPVTGEPLFRPAAPQGSPLRGGGPMQELLDALQELLAAIHDDRIEEVSPQALARARRVLVANGRRPNPDGSWPWPTPA